MSVKINALTRPILINHRLPAMQLPGLACVETRATKEVSCMVMAAILEEPEVGYRVNVAVLYNRGGAWYPKDSAVCFSFKDALKRAYGLSRKHYAVTASRAFAGLLYDSVVPATDDIDC